MPTQSQWNYLNGPQGAQPQSVPAAPDPASTFSKASQAPPNWGGWTPTGVGQFTPNSQFDPMAAANAYRDKASGQPGTAGGMLPQPQGTVGYPTDFSGFSGPGTSTTDFSQPDPYMLPGLSQQIIGGLQQPSATGQFYGEHKNDLNGPSALDQYWNGVSGKFNAPGVTNNAQTAFNQFEQDRPNLVATPGLGGYYDDAEARTSANLNKQFAAKGAYGSSVDSGTVGSAVGGLEADRAKNEANYALARQNTITGFDTAAAGAARGADASSLGASQNNLSYLLGGGNLASEVGQGKISSLIARGGLASAADNSALARSEAEANIAGMTDTQRSSRENSQISNLLGLGDRVNADVGGAYADLQANDRALLDSIQGGKISQADAQAKAQEAVQQGNYQLAAMIMQGVALKNQVGPYSKGGQQPQAAQQ